MELSCNHEGNGSAIDKEVLKLVGWSITNLLPVCMHLVVILLSLIKLQFASLYRTGPKRPWHDLLKLEATVRNLVQQGVTQNLDLWVVDGLEVCRKVN